MFTLAYRKCAENPNISNIDSPLLTRLLLKRVREMSYTTGKLLCRYLLSLASTAKNHLVNFHKHCIYFILQLGFKLV